MEEFVFLDDIATADVAIESRGDTPEELFSASARATFEVMVDTGDVQPEIKKVIHLENSEIDGLLFDWLAEIIYLKDSEAMVFCKFEIKIKKDKDYYLDAEIYGEEINQSRHELRCDVKAITFHLFEVYEKDRKWIARFILDI
jgi:SHS2 domain-containing protein|tara:strand:- start:20 stop:448 length:429 start_codon:yes stop_codon:yes gene_type:complete